MQSHRYFLGAAFACALVFAGTGRAQAQMQVRADFNNDGFEDLTVGAPTEDFFGDDSGEVDRSWPMATPSSACLRLLRS
jgi:hypothetical protein